LHWHFLTERGMIFNYSRILMSMSRQKRCWRRIQDTRGLPRYTPILSCRKSVPRIIRCPNKNAKITAGFQGNVSWLNTLSALPNFARGLINNAMTSSSVISSFVAASALNVSMVEFLFLLKILNNRNASKISRQAVINLYFFIRLHAFYYYIYTTPIFNIPLTSTAY